MGCTGGPFTWQCSYRDGRILRERLDRGLCTRDWYTLYPNGQISCFPRLHSDHALLCLDLRGSMANVTGKRRLFRFESLWLSNADCETIIRSA